MPARQRNTVDIRPRRIPALSAQGKKRSVGSVAREAVPNSKHQIKEVHSEAKAVGRTSRQAVKGAESSSRVLRVDRHSTQVMRQTVQAANRAQQRAIQAAADALRGAVSSIRALIVPLAVGGRQQQQQTTATISAVVQELNQEYNTRLDEIKASVSHDEESMIGSRAPRPEVLAVYAVKTASDLTNGQDVVTMTAEKKTLLMQVFWAMNQFSSFTSTVPNEGDGGSTTTLYITVTAKAASEMADIYGFNADRRQQLAELLSDEYREMWNDVV